MKDDKAAAIKYFGGATAPVLLCKGRAHLAERLKQEAQKFGIPIIKDEELLKEIIELSPMEYVPEEMYQVLAEILSFVYAQENGK